MAAESNQNQVVASGTNAADAASTMAQDGTTVQVAEGTVGLETQMGNQATTVSAMAAAQGGYDKGLIISDVDKKIYMFKSGEALLMELMIMSTLVQKKSAVVEHFMLDEPKSFVTTAAQITGGSQTGTVTVLNDDVKVVAAYQTLLVKGVNGYTQDGQTETPGHELMLFVTKVEDDGTFKVRPVNGQKAAGQKNAMYSTIPTGGIPAGTKLVLMGNACYETQERVAPSSIEPMPMTFYLQKRIMNQVVSDYYDSQTKKVPFEKALIAEQMIQKFKAEGNRTLWAGTEGIFKVTAEDNMGEQDVFFTKGVRWQFMRQLTVTGKWTFEKLLSLCKMYYTGDDKPDGGVILCDKDMLEGIQLIDWEKHPEVTFTSTTHETLGWKVKRFECIFGPLDFKHEPTLDKLGWRNSGGLLCPGRLIHYQRVSEHKINEKVDGHEAKRTGLIIWDGLALKGSCHMWIDGSGTAGTANGVQDIVFWDEATAPTGDKLVDGRIYIFTQDCTGTGLDAKAQSAWQYDAENTAWVAYTDEMLDITPDE